MFATLEDETGNNNLILWPNQVERYRSLVLTARLWHVSGQVQRANGVIHIIVERLINLDYLLGELPIKAVSYRPDRGITAQRAVWPSVRARCRPRF